MWVVVDTKVQAGETTPVLGRFASEDEAARFIDTLPEAESGRYGLDGPAAWEPRVLNFPADAQDLVRAVEVLAECYPEIAELHVRENDVPRALVPLYETDGVVIGFGTLEWNGRKWMEVF